MRLEETPPLQQSTEHLQHPSSNIRMTHHAHYQAIVARALVRAQQGREEKAPPGDPADALHPPTSHRRMHRHLVQHDLHSFIQQCFVTVNPGVSYVDNWHIQAIAEHLRACERGQITRLILNMPPRYLKSLCVSVAWPAWLLAHRPNERILAASYTQQLANKHSTDCRLVMQSEWYQRLFPQTRLCHDQNEKHKFVTTRRGMRLACSVEGMITGEGGNILIVDDPHNPLHMQAGASDRRVIDWFEQVFLSRLDDKKKGVVVLVMQRLAEQDLSGHLLSKGAGWEHLCLPAIAPGAVQVPCGPLCYPRKEGEALHEVREGKKELEKVQLALGSHAFAAQYQQQPTPTSGQMIDASWWRFCDPPCTWKRLIHSWDTAIKSSAEHDYSVCTVWAETEDEKGQPIYFLLEIWREKVEYPALKKAVLRLAERYPPDAVLIEDKASGQVLLQELRRQSQLPLIPIMPRQDKVTRMAAASALIEAGRVVLPRKAAWLAEYQSEMLRFPRGAHDDQVDSTSQFLCWVKERNGVARPRMRRV